MSCHHTPPNSPGLQRTTKKTAIMRGLWPHAWNGWLSVQSQSGLLGLSIGVGLGSGLQVPLYAPFLGDLFDRAGVGLFFGVLTFGYGLIGGWGRLIWATIGETTGHYNSAASVSMVCYAIAAVAILLVSRIKTLRSESGS